MVKDYQREFVNFCLENNVLTFGKFTLKSGRVSPYFFNAGLFNNGKALARLSEYYAAALNDYLTINPSANKNLLLFGPAYKGIPLVSSVAMTMFTKFQNYLKFLLIVCLDVIVCIIFMMSLLISLSLILLLMSVVVCFL